MDERNPYTISFGKIPTQYISRTHIIESISEAFDEEPTDEQAFKLTGIRGTGKTVTLTALEKRYSEKKEWIVLGLRSDTDIMSEIVSGLYSAVPFIAKYIEANLNLSAFGIELKLTKSRPVTSIDYALKVLLEEIKRSCWSL